MSKTFLANLKIRIYTLIAKVECLNRKKPRNVKLILNPILEYYSMNVITDLLEQEHQLLNYEVTNNIELEK